MKILLIIFYLLTVMSVVSIYIFILSFFDVTLSYLYDKNEKRYIKMPVSQIISYISLAPEKYKICEGKVLRGSLVLLPNSFIGYIKISLFEHKLEKKKANILNKRNMKDI